MKTEEKQLELDKLDLEQIKMKARESALPKNGEPESGNGRRFKNRQRLKYMFMIGLCVALLLATAIGLWMGDVIQLSPMHQRSEGGFHKTYVEIGPIDGVAGKAGKVKMTLQLKLRKPEFKPVVQKASSRIKDRLILHMAGCEEFIKKRDYEQLKPYLKKEIDSVLPKQYVEDVYLANILIY